jgi:2'-5' RNA ligase
MTPTIPVDTNQRVIAYWIASPVSDELARVIAQVQAALKERFADAIWPVPRESLHITFNALSPIFGSHNIDSAPGSPAPEYTEAFRKLTAKQPPIKLLFDTVEAFPAAIILKAQDDGSYHSLRSRFNESVKLPKGTKATPNIIHTTICKFHRSIDLDEVKDFLATKSIEVNTLVSEFRVVREKILYMVDYDILERVMLDAEL